MLNLIKSNWIGKVNMTNEYFSCKCDEGNSRCSEIKGKDRLTRTPPFGFCERVTLLSSNYVFCSHKHVFKGFSLFVRDDWRFCCHKKTSFEFSLPSIIAHFLKKHHCSSSSLHLSSTKKKLWLVAYRSSSHTSGMYILCSFLNIFSALPAILLQNKLCVHYKHKKCGELRVKIYLFNVFVMYTLDLAHAMVWHTIWSWSFANLSDKPGQVEWQVDPNTNLLNLINSNVKLFMCRS